MEKKEVIKPPKSAPKELIKLAVDASKELKNIVEVAKLSVDIKGRKYLKFEAWQTMGHFFGITSGIEWTKEIKVGDLVIGYEARAYAIKDGAVISNAEAICSREEDNWKDKPLWQIRSMAQTRACAKVLRNVLAWTIVLAGYPSTPAEEIEDQLSFNFSRKNEQ